MASNRQPVIVLVAPQLEENVGMCARAMLNCGLERLRLVAPSGSGTGGRARAAASKADAVLDGARVFDSVEAAVADCHRVYATTARERTMDLPVVGVESAAADIREFEGEGGAVAVLFGTEASGLDNEAVSRADRVVTFPTNPAFSSLNLAQAVLLFGWEWRRAGGGAADEPESPAPVSSPDEPATREELERFLERLEDELERRGFFLTAEMRPHGRRTLRSLFGKTRPSRRELNFLHGVISALTGPER